MIQEIKQLAISPEVPCLGAVADVRVMGDKISVILHFYHAEIAATVEQLLSARYHGFSVSVDCATEKKQVQQGLTPFKNINNIIVVASGKGGVGKSSVALLLALALKNRGAKVGLLDADIYGPSVPTLLALQQRPEIIDKRMQPHFYQGIESNSIGYWVDGDTAMIWRAPMILGAFNQLLNDTDWGKHFDAVLDYLVIDMPPGTGDIALSIAQKVPITGAVIVSTPQDLALADASRALKLFQKMHIDVLGLVENMAFHVCSQCGHLSHPFAAHGALQLAEEKGLHFLGELPLSATLREALDNGMANQPVAGTDKLAQAIYAIADAVAIGIAEKPKSFSSKFGKIVVENMPR